MHNSTSGGSLLADLLARTDGPIKNAKIFAAARSDEQVKSVSKLGINVLQVDLTDEKSVLDGIVRNESMYNSRTRCL